MNSTENVSTLLICTVGGSPEPIAAALKQWRPLRVRFVHTPQTKEDVEAKVIPMAREEGVELDAGRYDLFELPDGQDLGSCLDHLRQLNSVVTEWSARGPSFQVIADFTGGTKCMSAALGIQATRWPCVFSYVGGSERTKNDVGVVVSGTEKIVHQANPWDELGYQAVQDFVVLFDQSAFLAAANVTAVTLKRVSRPDRRSELAALEQLARALDAWDRFDHAASKKLLDGITKSANNLRAVLGAATGERVINGILRLAEHLGELIKSKPPSRYHVLDLLANAKRRKDEGRFDDAVARLYRAIEAIAQVTLKERHGLESTEKIPLESIPEPMRKAFTRRAADGVVALGLQDAFELLSALSDPIGVKFQSSGLCGAKSPLVARNRSILAHGFERVSTAVCEKLWSSALLLTEVDAAKLPSFPKLAETENES